MTRLQELEGAVFRLGAAQRDARTDCYLLEELVLKNKDGQLIRLTDVVVPGGAFSLLVPGDDCRLHVLQLAYPKPIGTFDRAFVVRVLSNEGLVEGAENVRKWVSSSKGAAFHYLWYGLVLLPAFGFGLLLWACALRLLALKVPSLAGDSNAKG